MENMKDVVVYRQAARTFWPEYADFVYDEFERLNALCFAGLLRNNGIVIGLTPHGRGLGFTDHDGRVTLHPSLTHPKSEQPWHRDARLWNEAMASDVLLHEMIHVKLIQTGADLDGGRSDGSSHNNDPWCAEVERISPIIGLGPVIASPWRRKRLPKDEGGQLVYAPAKEGSLSREAISMWPYSVRPDRHYEPKPTASRRKNRS